MLKYALSLGRVAGIKIAVHWTFLLLIGWIVWRESRRGSSPEEIGWVVFFVLTIFLCVTLHELGHALSARRFGIKTIDINLLPIGGVARLERMPEKPGQELVVAIAGPAVNVAIAVLLFPFVMHQLNAGFLGSVEGVNGSTFLLNLFIVNIVLTVFNLIPAFPMDGGRVLRALLSFKLQRHVATRIAATAGQFIAIFFIVGGFFGNPFLILIGLFIFMGAQAESELTANRFLLSGYKVNDVRMNNFHSIRPEDALSVPVSLLLDGQAKDFMVMEGGNVVGTLSRDELVKGLADHGKDGTVSSVMSRDLIHLDADMPLEEAYQMMQQHGRKLLPVMQNGKMIATIDLENVLEFILIKNATAKK